MKSILNFVAVCAVVALVGCSSTKTQQASPGAVGECSSKCSATCADKSGTNMGAVGEKANCAAACTKTCPATGAAVAPGAVSDSGCSKSQSSCTKTETVSPGAVGESGCAATKASCGTKTETVSPGAVSEKKSGCCASKTSKIDA